MSKEALVEASANTVKAATGGDTATPTGLDSVNGFPAFQQEGRGEIAGLSVMTLSTVVDTPDAYYNIVAVTPERDYVLMRTQIDQVIQSLDPQSATSVKSEATQ